MARTSVCSIIPNRRKKPARRALGSTRRSTERPARHRFQSRMEWPDAPGHRTCRRLCLERQDLPQPLEGRVRHHRQPLEWTAVLWAARQAIEECPRHEDRCQSQVRCAIYTRISTDQGLEQDFNSLDAQYDASQAYIRSQTHAGWTLLRAKYDDGGFSGGNTDRPALQRLLADVRAGKIDVIVVYKVDRLTRSLADFAKLVELFDQHNVSFVSVTQQFNTTTSMGRLTLERTAVVCPIRA